MRTLSSFENIGLVMLMASLARSGIDDHQVYATLFREAAMRMPTLDAQASGWSEFGQDTEYRLLQWKVSYLKLHNRCW